MIDYLKRTIPGANPQVTHALPPLPFADNSFDVVYAISIWTHHPLHLQWPWLREVNRVLKKGGLALISTSSYQPLKLRRKDPSIPGWAGVSDDDLRLEGVIYKRGDKAQATNPGAGGDWGYVLHDPGMGLPRMGPAVRPSRGPHRRRRQNAGFARYGEGE